MQISQRLAKTGTLEAKGGGGVVDGGDVGGGGGEVGGGGRWWAVWTVRLLSWRRESVMARWRDGVSEQLISHFSFLISDFM